MNKDIEDGLLDDIGDSRRFIKPWTEEELASRKMRNAPFHDNKKTKKSISHSIKYGNRKNEMPVPHRLSTAEQIRIAAGFQQAIVKVTSYGKGSDKIFNHISYITRNFDLPLEDQSQSFIKNPSDAKELLSTWQDIYFDDRVNSRDTVHMMFSVPPGTCRNTFNHLARDFLEEEFGNKHDYLFVQHNDTEHPHIHSIICLRSWEGVLAANRRNFRTIFGHLAPFNAV